MNGVPGDSSYGYVVPDWAITNLVGRVLTLIEALGLKDSQETSLKSLLREEIYSLQRQDEGCTFITADLKNEINRVVREIEAIWTKRSTISSNTKFVFDLKYKEVEA